MTHKQLKIKLLTLDLTQERLAKQMRLHPSTLSQWLKNGLSARQEVFVNESIVEIIEMMDRRKIIGSIEKQ